MFENVIPFRSSENICQSNDLECSDEQNVNSFVRAELNASQQCSLQLEFNFEVEIPSNKLALVAMEEIHGTQFCEFILDFSPRIALDTRRLVRFDLPGSSRDRIFQCFKASNTLYSTDEISWHQLRARDFLVSDTFVSQRLAYEIFEERIAPIMVMVQKSEHANWLHSHLNRYLAKLGDQNWQISSCA